jgi:galactonate dehydratase
MWTPVIVQVNTDEDISGVGELALTYGIGNNAGIEMIKDLSQYLLIGSDPLKIEYLWDTL